MFAKAILPLILTLLLSVTCSLLPHSDISDPKYRKLNNILDLSGEYINHLRIDITIANYIQEHYIFLEYISA